MTVRQTNLTFRFAAAAMIAIGVIVLAMSLIAPLETRTVTVTEESGQSSPRKAIADVPSLDQFAAVFSAPLRGSPVAASTQPSLTNTGGVMLVGTVGNHIALLRTGDDTEVRSVGDRVDGAELIAVRRGEVDMRTSAGVVTLRKPAETSEPDFIHSGQKQ